MCYYFAALIPLYLLTKSCWLYMIYYIGTDCATIFTHFTIFWNILKLKNILEYLEIPKYSGISWHFPIFWNILRLKNILEYLEIPKYSGISTNHQPPMSIHQAWNNKQQTTNLMTYNHNHQLLMTNIHILTMDNQNNLPPTNHQWESIKEKKQPTTNN